MIREIQFVYHHFLAFKIRGVPRLQTPDTVRRERANERLQKRASVSAPPARPPRAGGGWGGCSLELSVSLPFHSRKPFPWLTLFSSVSGYSTVDYRPSRSTSLSESSSKRRRRSKTTPRESEIIELAAPWWHQCGGGRGPSGQGPDGSGGKQEAKAGDSLERTAAWTEWARLPSSPRRLHPLHPYVRDYTPM